jgi:hypothetical protein
MALIITESGTRWTSKESETIAGVALRMLREADGGEVGSRDIVNRLVDRRILPRKVALYVVDVMAELSYSEAVKSRILPGPAKRGGDIYYRLTELGQCGLVRQAGRAHVIPKTWDGGIGAAIKGDG